MDNSRAFICLPYIFEKNKACVDKFIGCYMNQASRDLNYLLSLSVRGDQIHTLYFLIIFPYYFFIYKNIMFVKSHA